ncbi:MAG: DEAD/DEAH box helicase, partial [Cyclobacteriaceae bacterium]
MDEKLDISNDMLLLRARERMYEHVEYNRLNNRITYRDLYHQVTKKRRIWPLRRVISEFQDELFDLMPCWLASPESVSSLFPMRPFFDLVIFDEASQCFVEKGIPAMYRGRQLVVAGDDKQLRPNDLYQVRFEGETNDIVELEIDSLLELASKHLMQVHLKGHYRSQSLDLIDFSNRYFYNGNLSLLPEFNVVNNGEPAIEYRKVDGTWSKNINEVEASEVTSILIELIRSGSEKEVGVVTFNATQREFIQDMVDDELMKSGLLWPDSWFIKNIENVQGDEKDLIIFSVGYAPGKGGRMSLKFGSLNVPNGENRLNVAVTRARERIILVSSILPQQLKTERTRNEGPKLLKKYLEYAWEVSQGNFEPYVKEQNAHHPEWYLKSHLRKFGKESLDDVRLTEELPFADLTARQGEKYVGLILTDDERYFQAESVKESHVYLPRILNEKN